MIIELPDETNREETIELMSTIDRLFPHKRRELVNLILEQQGKGITIDIKPYKPHKTRQQENYYRKWCGEFARFCGLTPDEMHEEMLRRAFGSETVSTKLGPRTRPVQRSGRLTKQEYSLLIDSLIVVASELGFDIPPAFSEREV